MGTTLDVAFRDDSVLARFELGQPGVEAGGLMHGERLVGPEGGIHLRAAGRRGVDAVIAQVVGRVVGGADGLDLEFFQDALRGQFGRGELFVGLPPNFVGGLFRVIMVLVMTFYLSLYDVPMKRKIRSLLPAKYQPYFVHLTGRVQTMIGYWLRGQLLLCFIVFMMSLVV